MPGWWRRPELHHHYRALDVVHAAKPVTETHLYARLTDLTNLDLRFVCYDLTSSFFEGDPRLSDRFASKQFGYSRDHRSDRPQIMIGLVMTANGFPLAHHVFPGNTQDATTLTSVLTDVQTRFGIGPITVVADRGLVTAGNITAIADAGCGHILATKLHRARTPRLPCKHPPERTRCGNRPPTRAAPCATSMARVTFRRWGGQGGALLASVGVRGRYAAGEHGNEPEA
jgi:hypothetical protein